MAGKKALLVTTVSGFVPQFEMNNVKLLQDMGYEVHYASNYHTPSYGTDNHRLDGTGIIRHQIDFVRSPFKLANFHVYRQLRNLMKHGHFNLVHCHTPMGGVMARLAAHSTHTAPVIYTAHGFHFFQGSSLMNWLCYYPMERFLSRFTDQQICINHEDYNRARKTFHAKYVDYIPGVGINLTCFPTYNAAAVLNKKKELGIPADRIILLSSGELIKRKNHETILRAIAQLTDTSCIHYVICGHGKLDAYLYELTQNLGITNCVTFLGYRQDILEVLQTADVFLFPSYQEGLPVALLEAMASGIAVICSDIRGNRDLMGESMSETASLKFCHGGIMVKKADNTAAYCQALCHLLNAPQKLKELGMENRKRCEEFGEKSVTEKMEEIYKRLSH